MEFEYCQRYYVCLEVGVTPRNEKMKCVNNLILIRMATEFTVEYSIDGMTVNCTTPPQIFYIDPRHVNMDSKPSARNERR